MSRRPLRRILPRVALVLAALLLALGAVDLGVRWKGLDRAAVNNALYYQNSDLPVYRFAEDPFLHYTLRPGATMQVNPRPNQAGSQATRVSINARGARGPEHPLTKTPGTTRILFFGASTVFGAMVNDDETLPARLEQTLNARSTSHAGEPSSVPPAPPSARFEVWNFGTSGYAVSQVMRLARNRIRDIPGVDLVLVLPTNISRRPFLGGDGALSVDRTSNISVDPMFVLENIPAPARVPHSFHLFLFRWSALYRYTTAWTEAPRRDSGDAELRPAVRHAMLTLSQAETTALEREATARGVPVVLLQYPFHSLIPAKPGPIPSQGTDAIPADRTIDLYRPDMPDDFYQLHPAPEFLALHAWNLADELIERGFVKP